MGSLRARLAIVLAFATMPVGCAPAPAPVAISGEHDGLVVEGRAAATDAAITVDVTVRNARDSVIHLEPNQCGRVVDVRLERTRFRAMGRQWDGTVQAAKELVLDDQRFEDDSDLFPPRRVGDTSSATPDCVRPDQAIALDPGASIAERWELPIRDSRTLREVGSDDAVVSLEAIEARDPDTMEYFDIVDFLDRAKDREGRVARAELPLAQVLHRAATKPVTGPSRGELFDRLLENDELRGWIEAQPADGWVDARLQPAIPGAGPAFERVRLELVTRAFERSAVVTADADGSNPTLDLGAEAWWVADRPPEGRREPVGSTERLRDGMGRQALLAAGEANPALRIVRDMGSHASHAIRDFGAPTIGEERDPQRIGARSNEGDASRADRGVRMRRLRR